MMKKSIVIYYTRAAIPAAFWAAEAAGKEK